MNHPKISRPKAAEQHTSELDVDQDLSGASPSMYKTEAANDGDRLAQLQAVANNSPQVRAMASLQAAANGRLNSKLPEGLREVIAGLSGMDVGDVNVFYNSAKPAQLQAKAYAHGNEIHLAAGEEEHLPHEAWHVVQQRQGRVQPTGKIGGMAINSDPKLEQEADEMGAKAARTTSNQVPGDIKDSAGTGVAPVQRKITWGGKEWDIESAFKEIGGWGVFSSTDLSILYTYVLPAFDAQNRSFGSTKELINLLQQILPVMKLMIRQGNCSSLKELIKMQLDIQEMILKDEGLFIGLFTTCGFEHEFLGFDKTSFLNGLDHVEVGETSERFLYKKLPFLLETDGSNIIELVSPPFLIPVIMGRPIPCPWVTGQIDRLFIQTLKEGIEFADKEKVNLGKFVEWLNKATGLTFQLHEKIIFDEGMLASNVDCELLCENLQDDKNGEYSFSKEQLNKIKVGTSKKNQLEEESVSSQLNFATSMDMAFKFAEMNGHGNRFTEKLKFIEGLLFKFFDWDRLLGNTKKFGILMMQSFAGLYAVYSQKIVGKLQAQQMEIIKREMQKKEVGKNGSTKKPNPIRNILAIKGKNEFYIHERMMSFVKDVSNGWIKDHLVNMAISMLNLQECEELCVYLVKKQRGICTLKEPEGGSNFKHNDLSGHWEDFLKTLDFTVLKFIIDLSTRVSLMKSTNKNLDEISMDETDKDQLLVKEYIEKHPKLKFYQHDDTFAGARQGTYIPSEKVQMPKVWGRKLHVVEIRRGKPKDSLNTLKESVTRDQLNNEPKKVESENQKESKIKVDLNFYEIDGRRFNVAHQGIRTRGQCSWDTFRHYGIKEDLLAKAAKEAGLKIDDWLDDQDLDKLVAKLNELDADICVELTIFSYKGDFSFKRVIGKGKNMLIFGLAILGGNDGMGLGHFVPGK